MPPNTTYVKERVIAYRDHIQLVVGPEEYERNAAVYGGFDMDPCPGVIQTEILMNLYNRECKPGTNVSECQIRGF